MKLSLGHQWVDICQVVLIAMAIFSRFGMVAFDLPRRAYNVGNVLKPRKVRHSSFAVKPFYVMGLQLLAGLGLSTASAMAQEPAEMAKLDNAMTWNLTGTTIVNKGQVDVLKEGEFAHDFILEAKATATNPSGSVVPAGTFKLVLSAFSPAYDQRGQKKGIWYVRGKWILTDSNIPQSQNARQQAGQISGQINAELTFNPVVTQQNWTAKVRLPMTRIAPVSRTASSQPAMGEGVLTMDSKREGSMLLNLKLWPQMQQ